ncbi:hypothetical protein GCM10023080_005310 [Streptomyces pseudoechinosporeus]
MQGGEAADDLRGVGGGVVAVARVDTAGRVREVEVAARAQPGTLFQKRPQKFLRVPGDTGDSRITVVCGRSHVARVCAAADT